MKAVWCEEFADIGQLKIAELRARGDQLLTRQEAVLVGIEPVELGRHLFYGYILGLPKGKTLGIRGAVKVDDVQADDRILIYSHSLFFTPRTK